MKRFFGSSVEFAGVAIVAGYVLCGCNQEGQTQNEAKIHDLATLHDLAVKNSATQDWENLLTNKTSVFTIDVQDAFLKKSAPIAFVGDLVDISRERGRLMANFDVSTIDPFSLTIKLSCTEEQRKLLTQKHARCAVIAEIQSVWKPQGLTVNKTESGDEESGTTEELTFAVDWDADTYWVTGTCLDLKRLGE